MNEALPVEAIQRDVASTVVPVYDFPFVHQQLYAWGAARARMLVSSVVARTTGAVLYRSKTAIHCSTLTSLAVPGYPINTPPTPKKFLRLLQY